MLRVKEKGPSEQMLNDGPYIKILAVSYSPVANATVPSAQRVLASEFGMGSGVSLLL